MSATGAPSFDVKVDFGAKGDGATDDTAAIQGALDAARTGGGGVVYLPPGTYMLKMALRTGAYTTGCALLYGGSTVVRGAGRDATVLRLFASQPGTPTFPGAPAILAPWNVNQEQVGFEDLTVDGNAANQVDTHNGILMWRIRGVKVHRARVRDCHASASNQTFCFYPSGATDITFVDCEAIQIAGTSGIGFGGYANTGVTHLGCRAIGLGTAGSIGIGFSSPTENREMTYVGCHAYLCGTVGFLVGGDNQNIVYTGCHAGGVAADGVAGQQYPFTPGQSLGNQVGFSGFNAGPVQYVGCFATSNTSHGFQLNGGDYVLSCCFANGNAGNGFAVLGGPSVRAAALQAESNAGSGVNFAAVSDTAGAKISDTRLIPNTTAALTIAGVNYPAPANWVAAPAVPTSGTSLVNPFGFNATVYVTGGAMSGIALNGTNTGLTSGPVRLPATASITLTYTTAPTWSWFLE